MPRLFSPFSPFSLHTRLGNLVIIYDCWHVVDVRARDDEEENLSLFFFFFSKIADLSGLLIIL